MSPGSGRVAPAPSRRAGERFAGLGVALALAAAAGIHALPESLLRETLARAASPRLDPALRTALDADAIAATLPADGNLALVFEPQGRGARRAALAPFYYRLVYTLYPRRAYVADEGTVVNDGRDLAGARLAPDRAWLRGRDVRWLAIAELDASGLHCCRLEALRP